MGMYTEVYVTGRISEKSADLEQVMSLFGPTTYEGMQEGDHPFFSKPRWRSVVRGGMTYYFSSTESVLKMKYDEIGKFWSFVSLAHLKNYDQEAQSFFDWLETLDGVSFFGYHRYEERPDQAVIRTNVEDQEV